MQRRAFLKGAATTAAGLSTIGLAGSRVLGANDAIRVGIIGYGGRCRYLVERILGFDDVRIVAIADTYTGWREALVQKVKEKDATANVAAYGTYRELLDADGIDAVVIATPEHAHGRHLLAVIASGRDVYCEKPMVHKWEEAVAVVEANKQPKRIIQIGTQRRSSDIYPVAREIVQSGKIGQITQVRAWWNRNSGPNDPQWRYPIPDDASPETCNWKEFQYDASHVPFDKHRYFQWRCYRDYSGGPAGDLMVHQLDAINMVMGSTEPRAAVGMGEIYRWTEQERSTSDTWNALIEHPGGAAAAQPGFAISYTSMFSNVHYDYREQYLGTDGALDMNDRDLKVYAEPDWARTKDVAEVTFESKTDHTKDHLRNFFDCCRSRNKPNCNEVDGAHAAIAAAMTLLAQAKGRQATWDAAKQQVKV